MIKFLTTVRLAEALRRAEQAHARYEAGLSHRDDNWADWYAKFIAAEQPLNQEVGS